MNDAEQVAAYAQADFSETDQAMVDRILAGYGALPPRRIVDLGCGPGNIILRLAAAFPLAEIIGVDGAPAMLEVARGRVAEADRERVHFVQANLPTEGHAEPCDLIVSNSLLHHLHDPAVFWREVRAWAGPEAEVFIADLARPETPEAAEGLTERYAADAPRVLRADFHASLFAAFDEAELRAQLAAADLGHLSLERPTDRHVYVHGPLHPRVG